jgi:hypothetical protein
MPAPTYIPSAAAVDTTSQDMASAIDIVVR